MASVVLGVVVSGGGCKRVAPAEIDAAANALAVPSSAPADPSASPAAPPPRKGMIWIPEGTLIAGTPRDRTPRVADEELPAVPLPLHGFFIDEFAYPNESGAIPKTGMNREEGAQLCAMQEKRLCSELEWERACKGPSNTTYEYGDVYRPAECGVGGMGRLPPSGMRVLCKSSFGVKDMHGGAWEWTSSPWRRGSSERLASLRGGNAESGELVGRCANAIGRPPSLKKYEFGVRCCAGEANSVEVSLEVAKPKVLTQVPLVAAREAKTRELLARQLPPELDVGTPVTIDRNWLWHPTGNEEVALFAACARTPSHLQCGIVAVRFEQDDARVLLFASSGWWAPVLKEDHATHDVWVYGGDHESNFRRKVTALWGRVNLGELERRIAQGT